MNAQHVTGQSLVRGPGAEDGSPSKAAKYDLIPANDSYKPRSCFKQPKPPLHRPTGVTLRSKPSAANAKSLFLLCIIDEGRTPPFFMSHVLLCLSLFLIKFYIQPLFKCFFSILVVSLKSLLKCAAEGQSWRLHNPGEAN